MKKKISKFDEPMVEDNDIPDDNIKNGEFVIKIDGEIGWEITANSVSEQLEKADGQDVIFEVASPGGSVSEAIEIFNVIRNYEGNTEAKIVGMAASAASYIPLATDKVLAEDNAIFMIHNAWGMAMGDCEEMRDTADILESMNKTIALGYVTKTGKTEKTILDMMTDETWLFGKEIKDAGFVDEMIVHNDDENKDKKKKSKDSALAEAKTKFKTTMSKDQEKRMKIDLDKMKNMLTPKVKAMSKFIKWSNSYKAKLSDDAFAVVSGKGKDKIRQLPFKDQDGKVDIPHLRNAIIRLSQGKVKLSAEEISKAMVKLKSVAAKYLKTKTISADIMSTAFSKFEASITDKLTSIVETLKKQATDRKPEELIFQVKEISLLIQDLEDCISMDTANQETDDDDDPEAEEKTESKEKVEKTEKKEKPKKKTEKKKEEKEEEETTEETEEEETEEEEKETSEEEKKEDTETEEETTEEDDYETETKEEETEESKFEELITVCDGFKAELEKSNKLTSKFKAEIKVHVKEKDDLKQELSKFRDDKYTKLLNSTVEKVSKFKGLNETDKLKLKQEYLTSKMSDSALEEVGRITEEQMFSKLEEPKETTKPTSQLNAAEEPKEFSKLSQSEKLDTLANLQAKQRGFVIK